VPAVSLVIDWVSRQPWADPQRIVVIGASLGVPFAASAAVHDSRVAGVMLVHGAADNRLWLQAQIERRIDTAWLHYPLSVVLHWLAYGPIHNTSSNVAEITPRSRSACAGPKAITSSRIAPASSKRFCVLRTRRWRF
jgi:hypothetical protein